MEKNISAELVVLGGGPGGYTAAFRAADLGKKVLLIEQNPTLGGVCLNVGCIPSKILLHLAGIISAASQTAKCGITFQQPEIDLNKIRIYKNSVIKKLTTGLALLAKKRNVEVLFAHGEFISANEILLKKEDENITVNFAQAIIAAGSSAATLDFLPNDPRIIDATIALELKEIPKKMLIIGGGIIGLEMATIYSALGSEITIVEFMDQLIPNADADLVKPLQQILAKKIKIFLRTKVSDVAAKADGLWVNFSGENAPNECLGFDKILVAVGRKPNSKLIGAENAKINIDKQGFILVNEKMQTSAHNIYAIGDIVGNPMLAHKASYQGRLVAEIINGSKQKFTDKCIPSVTYTNPEIAWAGLTEKELKQKNIAYEKAVFPWAANGRALTMDCAEGLTKLLFSSKTKQLLGAGIVGANAGELIAELVLAIEKECKASEIANVIHPHPTLSETIMRSAEIFERTITDL